MKQIALVLANIIWKLTELWASVMEACRERGDKHGILGARVLLGYSVDNSSLCYI